MKGKRCSHEGCSRVTVLTCFGVLGTRMYSESVHMEGVVG